MTAARPTFEDKKPKLVFFQWNHFPNLGASSFLALHMQHHVKCLSQFFDVTVVNENCDYGAVCDRLEPDLALFEAGYRTHGSRRISIANTDACPQVPKLGLHNGDPWCDRRSGFLADMDAWGIETYFAIGTAMPEYTPTVAERTFVWPNFFDPEMFRDYGLEKTIPVALIGQVNQLYPWRQKVYATLSDHYPCLVTPPFQYESSAARRLLAGERYARALNASWVSPTCGTMGHELVRKHLEIPASACLLIAERTPVLESAGFRDGENCVFCEPDEVLDKLDALFASEDHMRDIIAAGHRLAHERHTLWHRPQIREWYELNRQLGPGKRIEQPGPFEPLRAVDVVQWSGHGHLTGSGLDRIVLERASALVAANDLAGARADYQNALDFVPYLPEALLGLALCDLCDGQPGPALRRLAALIETTVTAYGAAAPDPVEWAMYLAGLLVGGRAGEAVALRNHYPAISHPELRHIQRVLDRLAGRPSPQTVPPKSGFGRANSIHQVAERSETAYLDWLDKSMQRAGQPGTFSRQTQRKARQHLPGLALRQVDRALRQVGWTGIRPSAPPTRDFPYASHCARSVARKLLRGRARDAVLRLRSLFRLVTGGANSHRRTPLPAPVRRHWDSWRF